MTRYRDQFTDVVNYIDTNLDSELDVEKLCRLACLSKYHFHRQFSSHFGMPVISLARLLRLKRASYQLAYRRDTKIVDIAMSNGFASHEAFSRAFKNHFNKSPFQFRKNPDWTPWHSKYEPVIKLRTKIMNDNYDFEVKLIEFPETLIAVMEHRGAPNLLGKTIQQFIEWRKINHLPPKKSKTFNLVYDDPAVIAPENFRFDLCCSVNDKVAPNDFGIVNKTIPKGRCAVVRHIGSDESIGMAVRFLYSTWLINSDFEVRDFSIFFESVSFYPDVPENEMITDIYLPID